MSPGRVPLALAALLWLALLAWPFLTASLECGRRLDLYFLAGVGVLVGTVALPFRWPAGRTMTSRAGLALKFGVMTVAVWVMGGVVGEVRLMCRLF